MNRPRIPIDFNAMIARDLVLLSKTNQTKDVNGNTVNLQAGMQIEVIMDDVNDKGKPDPLIAKGVVEKNNSGAFVHCKWNIRIDKNGIRNVSDIK